MIIQKKGSLVGQDVLDFEEDGIRIQSDGFASVEYCSINDTLYSDKAHRDGIQLIPVSDGSRSQFAAAMMLNALIQNNNIKSEGKLQGVFSSDGCYQNLTIRNNVIDTNSQWKVSINGLLSGWIDDNKNADGDLVPVDLWNLRIGGGGMPLSSGGLGCSVYVLDFDDYEYDRLEDITSNDTSHINDKRGVITNTNDVFIRNFRYDEFREKSLSVHDDNAQKHGYLLQVLAMQCGDVVYK
jgi:hypothetical protein